jgi:hypothetical protein
MWSYVRWINPTLERNVRSQLIHLQQVTELLWRCMCEDSGDDFRVSCSRTSKIPNHALQVRYFAARLFRSLFGDSRFITTHSRECPCFNLTRSQSRLLGAQAETHIIRVPLCQPTRILKFLHHSQLMLHRKSILCWTLLQVLKAVSMKPVPFYH